LKSVLHPSIAKHQAPTHNRSEDQNSSTTTAFELWSVGTLFSNACSCSNYGKIREIQLCCKNHLHELWFKRSFNKTTAVHL